ncbi:MAG: hypothetical protein M3N28_05895 [Actinomycetota bacterium]|nr:hypothetical protein [Actinomycetota bacterium]
MASRAAWSWACITVVVTSARLLQDGSQGVGRPAEPSGEGVGVVDSDEQVVNILHFHQQLLPPRQLTGPHPVQEMPAELGRRFGQPAEPCRRPHADLFGARQGPAVD